MPSYVMLFLRNESNCGFVTHPCNTRALVIAALSAYDFDIDLRFLR